MRLKAGDNTRFINDHDECVAEVGPYYRRQPDIILFYQNCSNVQRKEVMHYAASLFNRAEWEREATDKEILRDRGVRILELDYQTSYEAIKLAVEQVAIPSLRVQIHDAAMYRTKKIVLIVGRDHRFEFWREVNRPKSSARDWALYLVPTYHPSEKGQIRHALINGCTGANIGDSAVRTIFCPPASLVSLKFSSSSWSHTKHPYLAVGRRFTIEINENEIRREDGVRSLTAFIRAALRLDGRYIAISGGFSPPFPLACNLPVGPAYSQMRGSENDCVWEYRTLLKEGKLGGAFIPEWFLKEEWLRKYQHLTEVHGVY